MCQAQSWAWVRVAHSVASGDMAGNLPVPATVLSMFICLSSLFPMTASGEPVLYLFYR